MKNRILVLTLCVFVLSSCVVAQQPAFTLEKAPGKVKNAYKEADYAYALGKTSEAVNTLSKTVAEQPGFVNGWWFLGNIYFENLKKYDSAIICFDKVKALAPNFRPDLDFTRGKAYMYGARYAEAEAIFKAMKLDALSDAQKQQAGNFVQSCHFAANAVKNPKKFRPINLGEAVNSKFEELMPSTTADDRFLYFTRTDVMGNYANDNIYMSEQSNGIWGQAVLVGRPISTDEYNEGATFIVPSGKYLFFTSCGREDAQGRSCDLYFTKRIQGNWDRPKNLGRTVNSPGWDVQPCLAPDGRTLYFASKRLGGFGGSDIYVTRLGDDGSWSEPENLGKEINTPFDEERPFIHPDGMTLYFSSKGHPGMGNADFFFSKRDASGKWTTPVNMGYPINTPGDEIGIYITTDGNTAFIGSERPEGFGGMDIYKFEMDESNKPQHVTYVKGHIYDEQSKTPLVGTIELFDLSDSTGKRYSATTSDDKTGEFLTTLPYGRDYACSVNKDGYLFYSGTFTLKDYKSDEPYKLDVYLKKAEIGKSVVLNNIFFEVNKFDLREESKAELNTLVTLMKKQISMTIEVGGHTDNSGDEKANKTLSEQRAKAVVDYVVSQGINASRLTYKGYGSSKPIASNSTDAGKQQNRRTEFTVTGFVSH